MQKLIYFLSGFIFALGLGVSGMTDPNRVKGFLDILGEWNPSLMFVMVGAITVHCLIYMMTKKMSSPFFDSSFSFPLKSQLDWKLIIGSLIFGIGWGLGGYCPGPAIASLSTFSESVIVFSSSMFFGFFLFHKILKNKRVFK